jgi:hypothetical protein
MYLGFNARGFFPINTKWAGSSRLSGFRRRSLGLSAGPFYGRRRRLGQDVTDTAPMIDTSYSPLPDLTPPSDVNFQPLILIPSSFDTTASILPSTLTPPPSAPAAQSPLNLLPSVAPSIASVLQNLFTPKTASVARPGVPPVVAASVLPGVSGTTLLLWGGGALLLFGAMGRRK